MSVVRRSARRRWSVVLGGVLALCLVPVVLASLPAPNVRADAGQLRALILASADQPYQGFAETQGEVNLPDLPELSEVVGLLRGTTRLRAWYASPQAWRVALVSPTGERDVYQTAQGTYVWDFERNLMTHIVGRLAARLPWAADFTPPDLARRLLRSGTPEDRAEGLPARRVAGIDAAGVRLISADSATTLGRVDVWADPSTGLPLQVEIAGRGGAAPVFTSRFMEVRQQRPEREVLTPAAANSAATVTTEIDTALAIDRVVPVVLPASLAGRSRLTTGGPEVSGVGAYGTGWSRFVVLALPGRVGYRSFRAARNAGGVAVELAGGEAVEIRASLLNAIIVRSSGDRWSRRTYPYLVAGFVDSSRLRQAAVDLLASPTGAP